MLTRKLLMMLGGALLIPQAVSRAEVLTFAMEGPITSKDDRLGLLDFAEVGQRVVYTFSFDTEAEDSHSDPMIGWYQGLAGSFRVGETTVFATSAPNLDVYQPSLCYIQSAMDLDGRMARLAITLSDQDLTAIASPALPTQPYDLAEFESKYFSFYVDVIPPVPPDTYFTRLTFWADIDRFYIIPEPASAVLVGLGVAGVIRRRRWPHVAVYGSTYLIRT